jgi:hypothetical protein
VKLVKDLKHAVVAALLVFYRLQVLVVSEVDRPVDQVKLVLRNAYTVVCSSQQRSLMATFQAKLTEPKIGPRLL